MLQDRMRLFDPQADINQTRSDVIASIRDYAGIDTFFLASSSPIPNVERRLLQTTELGFDSRNSRLEEGQREALVNIEEQSQAQSDFIAGILSQTRLPVRELLRPAPTIISDDQIVTTEFIMYLSTTHVDPEFIHQVQLVMGQVTETRRYQEILRHVPLSVPLQTPYHFSSGFGVRPDPFDGDDRMHSGLDLVSTYGSPIVAPAAGVIIFAGQQHGYGNVIYINHGYGFITRYGHLSEIRVHVGQRVLPGQRIGSMGSTGRSTGTHLHYEIRYEGRAMNPVSFLQAGRAIVAP